MDNSTPILLGNLSGRSAGAANSRPKSLPRYRPTCEDIRSKSVDTASVLPPVNETCDIADMGEMRKTICQTK